MNPVALRLWRRTVRRLGYAGPAAVLLLVVAAAIALALPRLQRDHEQTQADLRARAAAPVRGLNLRREPGRDEGLEGYVEAFPLRAQMAADLGAIYAAAERQHVALPKGEYQLNAEPNSPFVAYVVTLPVHAEYGPVKAFAASVLQELPHASLDELRLSREAADVEVLDAVVRFSLTYRSR